MKPFTTSSTDPQSVGRVLRICSNFRDGRQQQAAILFRVLLLLETLILRHHLLNQAGAIVKKVKRR